MDRDAAIEFQPVYGWGWLQGTEAFEVPDRLVLRVGSLSSAAISGIVLEPPLLAGAQASLSLRSREAGLESWSATFSGGTLASTVTGFVQSLGCTPNNSFKPTPLRGAA